MISVINQEIEAFLSSVKGINESSNQMILDKFSTSISDNLKNGHLTTNVCMIAASVLKLNPKELAKDLEKHLKGLELFKDVVSAGPGFINITLKRKDFVSVLLKIKKIKEEFGESSIGNDKRVQIEFVSANPTGPLHVGHGRGAAYGDALGRILKATGNIVEKEYFSIFWNHLFLSFLVVSSYILIYIIAALSLGLDIDYLAFLVFTPIILFSMTLPISIGGWGIRETTALFISFLLGLSANVSISVAIIYGLLSLICSLPGLILFLSTKNR